MDLFEKLPQEEVHLLWKYLDTYSDGDALPETKMDFFLRYWKEAKLPFYRMFGEQFIIKKDVVFDRSYDDLAEEMEVAVYAPLPLRFTEAYKNRVREICGSDYEMRDYLYTFVDSLRTLVSNTYKGLSFTISGDCTVTDRPLAVNSGCKAVKMLGKIASAIGVKVEARVCKECGRIHETNDDTCLWCGGKIQLMDGYEAFRLAHSLVLNQKSIRGKLCLSVHPLDFLTMSDNDCNWESCMSWVVEYGDYRLGTIEMMNSPCVVIAYVEAKTSMSLCGEEWNNKRWRQLFIVTREMILGNRQYPYNSDVLQGAAIKWLREMCQQTIGWGPYTEEANKIRNDSWNTINGNKDVQFLISCDYMYNDICGGNRLAYVAPSRLEAKTYSLNFSGPAVCTGCGEVIPYNEIDPSQVQCRACSGYWQCDHCGDWHSSYEDFYDVDGYTYCEWCYEEATDDCECCGCRTGHINHVYIQIVDTKNEDIIRDFNYNYYISMCDDCFDDETIYEKDFGPMHDVIDMWGNHRKAFDIRNISDDRLFDIAFFGDTRRFLEAMRDSESDEERLKLI